MTAQEARNKILSMNDTEKKKYQLKTCPRCMGTGTYSYCTMYGNTCFKCNGVGFVKDRRLKKD